MNVRVFKNISHENELNKMQVMEQFNLVMTCDEHAAQKTGRPPQRIGAGKHMGIHRTALRREAIMPWLNDFHGSGVNPGSWVFLQSMP